MKSNQWYLRQNGTEIGPLLSGELKRLANDGKIVSTAELRAEGTPHWVPVSKVKEIAPFCTDIEIVAESAETKDACYPPPPPLPSQLGSARIDAPPPPIPKTVLAASPTAPAADSSKNDANVKSRRKEKWVRIGGNDEPSKIGSFIKYVVSGIVAGALLYTREMSRLDQKRANSSLKGSKYPSKSDPQKSAADHQKIMEAIKKSSQPSNSSK